MGISQTFYLGAYIEVPKQEKRLAICTYKCQDCYAKANKMDNFCSACGGKVREIIKEQVGEWSSYSFLYQCLSEKETLTTFDPEDYYKHDHYIYFPNIASPNIKHICIKMDGEDGGVWELENIDMEFAKKMLEMDFAEEIALIKKEMQGNKVNIKFGMLRYFW